MYTRRLPEGLLWSVGFISLGCAKNLVDTEHMASVLAEDQLILASTPESADIVVINTCGFIGDAKKESIDTILAACSRKQAGEHRRVLVGGCLVQRYSGELRKELPEVDAFFGLDEIEHIGRLIRRLESGSDQIFDVKGGASRRLYESRPGRLVLTGGPFAYLKIAEGCNHRCGFCAIPMIRGKYRSRPISSIVREAEQLLEGDVRELNLISQDTTAYGRDLGSQTHLPALLRALGKIGGDFWIRLLYSFPLGITDQLLAAMAEVPQVCHYLDVPVQHSHPTVLQAMHRGGTAAAVALLPQRLRAVIPDMVIRTTCLVGYPGETALHFNHLLAYVREAQFDHLGVFAFSREEGTLAATLAHQVPSRIAEQRRDILMRAQHRIVADKGASRKGQAMRVLLEKPMQPDNRYWVARSAGQAPEVDGVTMVGPICFPVHPGQFLGVTVKGKKGYDLMAIAAKSINVNG